VGFGGRLQNIPLFSAGDDAKAATGALVAVYHRAPINLCAVDSMPFREKIISHFPTLLYVAPLLTT
jgi:hypothetical protein